MKRIFFLVLFVATLLGANKEYNLKYKLFNDGAEVGTLEALSKRNDQGIFKYSTRLDIELSFLFMQYNYLYVEDAYVEDEEIVSLFVYEKYNDDVQKIKAVKDGDNLVYINGTKVELSKIDYLPFDFMPMVNLDFEKKEFILNTFDSLSGKVFSEKNTISKSKDGKYHIETIGLDDFKEEKIVSKDGVLEYIKNKHFEAKLIK